ncbi:MAG: hypothetical protein E7286_04655 [Lachnospiraceae bacterium]|nr:hypothetical protein [Lachnospiraceae bacterium]
MWSIIFTILMFVVFGKLLKFAIKATWGIAKIVVSLIMLPLFLIVLVLSGLIALALPILLVVGIVVFAVLRD